MFTCLFSLAALGACNTAPTAREAAPTAREAASSALGDLASTPAAPLRIVSLGGTVTELVFALGAGADVIAVDASSSFPPEVRGLAQVGYHRNLSAEGILALNPTLLIATEELGPPAVVTQLRSAGVRLEVLTSGTTPEAATERMVALGQILGRVEEAQALIATFGAALARERAATEDRPASLFLYARGAHQVMVAGRATSAERLLALAGIPNAATSFEGFRPYSAETLIASQPAFLVMTEGGLGSVGGLDALLAMPGVAATPAGQHRRVVVVDDLAALGFGPRLPDVVAQLRRESAPWVELAREGERLLEGGAR